MDTDRKTPTHPSQEDQSTEIPLSIRLPFPPASTTNCVLTMYSLRCLLTKICKGPDGQIFLL